MASQLPPRVRKLVEKQIDRGRYKSEAAVLLDALRLLDSKNEEFEARRELLRAGIDRGLADAKAGRTIPIEEVTLQSVRLLAKHRSRSRRLRKSA